MLIVAAECNVKHEIDLRCFCVDADFVLCWWLTVIY